MDSTSLPLKKERRCRSLLVRKRASLPLFNRCFELKNGLTFERNPNSFVTVDHRIISLLTCLTTQRLGVFYFSVLRLVFLDLPRNFESRLRK